MKVTDSYSPQVKLVVGIGAGEGSGAEVENPGARLMWWASIGVGGQDGPLLVVVPLVMASFRLDSVCG